jgi:hypothetical protein
MRIRMRPECGVSGSKSDQVVIWPLQYEKYYEAVNTAMPNSCSRKCGVVWFK